MVEGWVADLRRTAENAVMLDQEALPAIHLLDGWGWQRPTSISEAEFQIAVENCAAVLTRNTANVAHDAGELKLLVEKSNRKLFAFMPAFRRSYEVAKGRNRKKILEDALAQCSNRFERRIVMGAAEAMDQRSS